MYRYVMITEMSDYIIIRYLLHCTRTLSLGHYYQKSRPLSCIKMMIAMFISWTIKISQETGPAVEELGYLQIVNEVTFEVAI